MQCCHSIRRYRLIKGRAHIREGSKRARYLSVIVHIHNVDWPVGITHKKYTVFIRLEDIQQVYVGSTVYEDEIAELKDNRDTVKELHQGGPSPLSTVNLGAPLPSTCGQAQEEHCPQLAWLVPFPDDTVKWTEAFRAS